MASLRMLIVLSPVLLVASAARAAPPEPAAIADKIVGEVAGVAAGEVVFVEGEVDDLALLNELWLAAGRRGALPLLRLQQPQQVHRWLAGVDQRHDGNLAALEDKLSSLPDVIVLIERVNDPALFNDIESGRLMAYGQSFAPLAKKRMARKTRIASLGNGLFPTPATAKMLAVSKAELDKLFWAGVATDYKQLAARGEAVKAALPSGKPIVITTPAGTELRLALAAKPMNVSDGVISADEVKQGGAALWTWVPAGEAYGLIEAGSAEGKIVMPRMPYNDQSIEQLSVTVKGGKVVDLSAKPSKAFALFKSRWDAAAAGKEMVSILDLGLNVDVRAKGKPLLSYVPAGNVTVFVGNDVWAGGSNETTWGTALYLTDATLSVDGKNVIDKGVLLVGGK